MDTFASTLLAQSNDPLEIQKADLDLLKKINTLIDEFGGSSTSSSQNTILVGEAKQARFVRVYSNGNSVNTSNHLYEVTATDINGTNRLSGKSPTSSATLTGASYATNSTIADGNYTTFGVDSQWIQWDMGALYSIKSIGVWFYFNDRRTYNGVRVAISTDASNWDVVYDNNMLATISGTLITFAQTASDIAAPVGTILPAWPNAAGPSDRYSGGWNNITNLYAGMFFRAEGGNAGAYGYTSQNDAIRNMTGQLLCAITDWAYSPSGVLSSATRLYGDGWDNNNNDENFDDLYFNASWQVPTAAENRPVNMSIRFYVRLL